MSDVDDGAGTTSRPGREQVEETAAETVADPAPAEAANACPPWCVTSSEEHGDDGPEARVHEGPRFGPIRTWWSEGPTGGFSASLAPDGDDPSAGPLDPDDLRHLASDALDAAIWLDRQIRLGLPQGSRERSVVDLVREAHARATRSA